jgi:hypothetical protein
LFSNAANIDDSSAKTTQNIRLADLCQKMAKYELTPDELFEMAMKSPKIDQPRKVAF